MKSSHLNVDGTPKYTNLPETKPERATNAHNPVDWYAWGRGLQTRTGRTQAGSLSVGTRRALVPYLATEEALKTGYRAL